MRLFFLTLLTLVILSAHSHAETVTVITKQNAIRTSCQFFAPVKATVQYNDPLEVISKQGDWYQVNFRGLQGCIHKSAVEKKSLSLSKLVGSGGGATSADEVALAGKGFNPQIEAAYKAQNPGANFGAVNRVENYSVSDGELIRFVQQGELNLP